jgi:thiamine biosynthesis lipoprotein
MVTSSIRVRSWTDLEGREVHHLIDPATGRPAGSGLRAVSVAHPDPAWAEVWSKSLFLAGRNGIEQEARTRGFTAWWVDEEGAIGMSPTARCLTVWSRPGVTPSD